MIFVDVGVFGALADKEVWLFYFNNFVNLIDRIYMVSLMNLCGYFNALSAPCKLTNRRLNQAIHEPAWLHSINTTAGRQA